MKTRIGILFGGKSAEHEVSIQSAANVVTALDKERFEPVLIFIDKEGVWRYVPSIEAASTGAHETSVQPDGRLIISLGSKTEPTDNRNDILQRVDVVFPVLHGPMGEDGSIQGMFELLNVPYVGSGILGSAVGMDKEVMKRLLRDAGIPIARFKTVTAESLVTLKGDEIVNELGLPLFVKPANMGSSVGVSKVDDVASLTTAVIEAFKFDTKVLIEEAIVGSEIECAVIGNAHPKASAIGRIAPRPGDFYSYEAKYIDEDGALLEIPAQISDAAREHAQAIALKTYQALNCEGMTRVDMFLCEDDSIVVNEVNTIPGFTKISMYPKLWEVSGVGYTELITRLIELATERFETRQGLQTSYQAGAS